MVLISSRFWRKPSFNRKHFAVASLSPSYISSPFACGLSPHSGMSVSRVGGCSKCRCFFGTGWRQHSRLDSELEAVLRMVFAGHAVASLERGSLVQNWLIAWPKYGWMFGIMLNNLCTTRLARVMFEDILRIDVLNITTACESPLFPP